MRRIALSCVVVFLLRSVLDILADLLIVVHGDAIDEVAKIAGTDSRQVLTLRREIRLLP